LTEGIVFNIQRYSIDDGPGIRTTVFLKGCPLRCLWCSNPESQKFKPEVMHRDSLCNECGECTKACARQAISFNGRGVHINRRSCNDCGKCVEVCAPEALRLMGNRVTVDEVLREVERDAQYYRNSGGGVTVSGGEPLSQYEFTGELFKRCREAGIHTCIDTCGYAEAEPLQKVMPCTSLVLFDLKHIEPDAHQELTKRSNEVIIRNLEIVAGMGIPTVIRVPLIPGLNDSDEALTAIARTVLGISSLNEVNLMPYHRFGMGKYKSLDRRYALSRLVRPIDAEIQRAKNIFESFGLKCQVAG